MQTPMPDLGDLILKVYGEDEVLTRSKKKASSRPIPGRMVWNKEQGKEVWSTLHERGNRKLISYDEVPCHTWVRNAYNFWTMQMLDTDSLGSAVYGAGTLGMRQTNGTQSAFSYPMDIGDAGGVNSGYRGLVASVLGGIHAGLGDKAGGATAHNFEDYKMQDLIEEGTLASEEMNYESMIDHTAANVTYSALVWSCAIQRFMNNNSGGDLTVEEVGLVTKESAHGTSILLSRDVLGGDAKLIADTGQFDCTYTVKSPSFPS